ECDWPASIRTFVVVCTLSDTTTPSISTPATSSFARSSLPDSSSPVTETNDTCAPSATRFMAQLAAPPGSVSVCWCRRINTGASRETLLIDPCRNLSAIASPRITIRCLANLLMMSCKSCKSCNPVTQLRSPSQLPTDSHTQHPADVST